MSRPDFSDYVVHFTKDAPPLGNNTKIIKGSAYDRLVAILKATTILATTMPWTNRLAVAFTECPWASLPDHAKRYSAYGVGFKKATLFADGGGPAIYLSPHLHEKQMEFQSKNNPEWKGFHSDLYSFVTPFCPPYAPSDAKKKWGKKPVDYSHEREWRVPHNFSFNLSQVEFVVVPDYEAMAKFPKDLKNAISRQKFILLEVYSQIEKLWPVHII